MARIDTTCDVGYIPHSYAKKQSTKGINLKIGEYELLKTKAQSSRAWYLWPVIDIAIETAMRRSEILGLD